MSVVTTHTLHYKEYLPAVMNRCLAHFIVKLNSLLQRKVQSTHIKQVFTLQGTFVPGLG